MAAWSNNTSSLSSFEPNRRGGARRGGAIRRGGVGVGPAQLPCPPADRLGVCRASPSQVCGRWSASRRPLAALHPCPRRVPRCATRSTSIVAMAFASWWYKTVNGSDRPWAGLGRERALPSWAAGEVTVQDFAGEGWGAGCDLLSDLQGRLRERLRPTLLWYVGASSDVHVLVGVSSGSQVEWHRDCCRRNSALGRGFLDKRGLRKSSALEFFVCFFLTHK